MLVQGGFFSCASSSHILVPTARLGEQATRCCFNKGRFHPTEHIITYAEGKFILDGVEETSCATTGIVGSLLQSWCTVGMHGTGSLKATTGKVITAMESSCFHRQLKGIGSWLSPRALSPRSASHFRGVTDVEAGAERPILRALEQSMLEEQEDRTSVEGER